MLNWRYPICNGLLAFSYWRMRLFFETCRNDVLAQQELILYDIVRSSRHTVYGRRYDFSSIKNIADFQSKVPVVDYEALSPQVSAIVAGQSDVLTREKVLCLAVTSGSSSAQKLIPMTDYLLEEFQRAVGPWLFDLFWQRPKLLGGPAYWSTSPVGTLPQRQSAVPVGFPDDSEYLGGWQSLLLPQLMAVPAPVSRITDMETFRYVTLFFLLKAKSLRWFSIWSPTFLPLLLAPLPDWSKDLLEDIRRGKLSCQDKIPSDLQPILQSKIKPDEHRARELQTIFSEPVQKTADLYARIWPELVLISCWADGQSAFYLDGLKQLFPHVEIQGKGLLATEAFVSFPLFGLPAPVLAIGSHFFEFEAVADETATAPTEKLMFGAVAKCPDARLRRVSAEASSSEAAQASEEETPQMGVLQQPLFLAHELKEGRRYQVIVSTAGGLYRYRLGDIIEVAGFYGRCPLVRFVGRGNKVSDLLGEKLMEVQVASVLTEFFKEQALTPSFFLLAPERSSDGKESFYALFLHLPERSISLSALSGFAKTLDEKLQANFHYQYCRRLGQLGAVRLFLIRDCQPAEVYQNFYLQKGQRLGDIKPAVLDPHTGWSGRFAGSFLSAA